MPLLNPTDLLLVLDAENSTLAWQWARSRARVDFGDFYAFQRGHAFEVMANDAHNWRHPLSRWVLNGSPNHPGVDAIGPGGLQVQYKTIYWNGDPALNKAVQKYALANLDDGGLVVVPKGGKVYQSPQVIESPVSEARLRRASTTIPKAPSVGKLIGRGSLIGALSGAGIQGGIEVYRLARGKTTPKQSAKRVAKEAGLGAISGGAVTAFGIGAASACAPGAVIVIGGLVVGAGARWGVEKLGSKLLGREPRGLGFDPNSIHLLRRRHCELCGGELAPVHYGFPTAETIDAAERGEVILGGCLLHPDNPQWACPTGHHLVIRRELWSDTEQAIVAPPEGPAPISGGALYAKGPA